MLRSWRLLILACVAANAFQQPLNSSPEAERRADVYAIYSLMMTNPKTSHGADDNQIYLINATTGPGFSGQPCVRAPRAYESRFAEVLAEYDRRKDGRATLERAFKITKSYHLLNGDDVKEFIEMRSLRPTPYPNPRELFQKATDLFTLSDIYFNRNRTLALTAISSWCGTLCGMKQWKVFEKTKDGQWEERNWPTCTIRSGLCDRPASWFVMTQKLLFPRGPGCTQTSKNSCPSSTPTRLIGSAIRFSVCVALRLALA